MPEQLSIPLNELPCQKTKVLGKKSDSDEVVLQDLEGGKAEQLWKKENARTDGYYIFTSLNVTKVLTAISENSLEITGNAGFVSKVLIRLSPRV